MKYGFCGEDPRFDAQVDSFEARAVEIAGGVADDQESIAIHARHREVTAFGNCFGAGGDHLAALENLANRRMQFVALELMLRIEGGIAIVEADDEADVH